jgi:hypothetical protein
MNKDIKIYLSIMSNVLSQIGAKAFLLSLVLFFNIQLNGQNLTEPLENVAPAGLNCGTPPMTEEQIRYTLDVVDRAGAGLRNTITTIPIRIHIVTDDGGSGGVSMADVNEGIVNLNNFYLVAGIDYYVASVNIINSTAWYTFDKSEEAAMTLANSTYDAVNVYFVDSITIPGFGGACGYAYYPADATYSLNILMNNDCLLNAPNGTFVHEFGHFFNLAHTHSSTENGNTHPNAENVPRVGANANCGTKGDLLCDTEADPNGSNDSSCNFINDGESTQDANGVTYTPDIDNVMSYYWDSCGGIFTPEQYTRIANGLTTRLAHTTYSLGGPTAVCTPGNAILDGSGNVTITAVSLDGGSTNLANDALTYTISKSAFTCADLGVNTVTLTVTDPNGFTDTCSTTVTITDSAAVAVVCQNPTIFLDGTGSATITAASLDGGSTAGSCGIASMYMTDGTTTTTSLTVSFAATNAVAGNMFDVVGVNPITIDSFDVNSNTSVGTLLDFEVYYKTGTYVGSESTAGDWTLVGTVIDIPSAGGGSGTPLGLSLGINVAAGETVAFYVTATDGLSILINGILGPVGDVWAADANVQVLKGAASFYPFAGSIQEYNFNGNIIYSRPTIFDGTFDCTDIGTNIITFNVTDAGGNISSCDATVTILDSTPTAITQNPILFLDALGNTSLTPSDIDNNSANFCGGTPFLAFETTSYTQTTTTSSPTEELFPGGLDYVSNAAFTVPVSGDYSFSMTSNTNGVFLIIWDDAPVPNSGYFDTRPEYFGHALWLSNGSLGSVGGGLVGGIAALEADKTYYMTVFDGDLGVTGTYITTIDMAIRTTAATREYSCSDIGVVEETLYVFDAAGTTDSATADVTVAGVLTTYSGGSWDNGTPTMGSRAVIDDALVTAGTSIEACACDVNAALTIESGDYLRVNDAITVAAAGVLSVDNGGSVLQVNDNADVTNNGSITVEKITPTMAAKSFMFSGSPMTAETREGVFGNAYIVRNHVTANFVPNPLVEIVSPGINNWADDNGNNWLNYTGLLNPGEGYMVFPQPDTDASGTYLQNHTLGTLNNGVINVPLGYNTPGPTADDNQNASPNILSNPYASAIDAEVFFDNPNNAGIDVLYFWEHITPLSLTYPGYNAANFSMTDISMYQEGVGGLPSASMSATPTQFVSSGQGFGVKPTGPGTVQFNNAMRVTGPNDAYRTSDPIVNRDRLWVNVYNETYGLGSTTLIAFTENTSDMYVKSEDVKRLATPISLYSELDSEEELGINALGTFETSDAVHLGFATELKETQSYRISIHSLDGENMLEATVYLIDALTGAVTNLSEGDYTFQSGEATYSKRFKVVFENSVLEVTDLELDSVSLYPNPTQNIITIVSPQAIVTSATIYDIRGRKVSEVDFRNKVNYQIDLSTMEAAVYFIGVVTESGTIIKRVIKE